MGRSRTSTCAARARAGGAVSVHRSARQPRSAAIGAALFFGIATIGAVQFLRPEGALADAPLSSISPTRSRRRRALPAVRVADARRVRAERRGEGAPRAARRPRRVPHRHRGRRRLALLPVGVGAGLDASSEPRARAHRRADRSRRMRPGFYHLAVIRGATREILAEPTLAVMVPFSRKFGDQVNGYRIGTYLSERLGGGYDRPAGLRRGAAGDARSRRSRSISSSPTSSRTTIRARCGRSTSRSIRDCSTSSS